MKVLLIGSLLSFISFGLEAINPPAEKAEVLFTCNVTACNKMDSIFIFEFNGVDFKKVNTAATQDWQTYQFKLPATGPRFYYVGLSETNLRPVILGSESSVALNGSCPSFQGAQLPGSKLNLDYETVRLVLVQFKNDFGNLLRQLQVAQSQENVDQMNAAVLQLRQLDKKRTLYLDSLKNVSPYLSKVAALNTYLSYQNNGTGDESEIEYFATKYFRFADWNDPDYSYMPWVFESIKDYTQVLSNIGLPDEYQKQYIDRLLSQIPQTSRAYMLALGGVMATMQMKKSPLLAIYAQRYVDLYRDSEPDAVAMLEQLIRMTLGFNPGAAAPDFTMNTPEDAPLSLSSLRGKYLLIDFWASWCGPCRVENPNVVKAYAKYHPKGFEILGVSLDTNRDRWVDAIAKDGLTWPNVSDLKGWQNGAAQLYGVSAIPHTVLLDPEGKIIERNLRGDALLAKLKELFGE